MAEQKAALAGANTSWNRMEVNRCLLPVLRFVDAEREGDVTREEYNELLQGALQACHARPDAYRQLAHVFCTGAEQTVDSLSAPSPFLVTASLFLPLTKR